MFYKIRKLFFSFFFYNICIVHNTYLYRENVRNWILKMGANQRSESLVLIYLIYKTINFLLLLCLTTIIWLYIFFIIIPNYLQFKNDWLRIILKFINSFMWKPEKVQYLNNLFTNFIFFNNILHSSWQVYTHWFTLLLNKKKIKLSL